MRVLLQRVKSANVKIDNEIVGSCNKGLCLFLGVSQEFDDSKLDWMVNKISNLRCWSDGDWGFDKNIRDIEGEILVVSQFTLHGRVHKGAKPDFSKAMKSDEAKLVYEKFVEKLRAKGIKVETGQFGAMMEVNIVNDGPFTLWLEK